MTTNFCTSIRDAGLPMTRAQLEMSLSARFEQVVQNAPDQVAILGDEGRWTYVDVNRRANRIAHLLRAQTPPGTGCIAILAAHSPEAVIAMLGVLKAGKACLVIHPAMPAAAQREIIVDAAPELVLSTTAFESRSSEIAGGDCPVRLLFAADGLYSEDDPPPLTDSRDPAVINYTSGSTGRPKGVVKSHRMVMHRVWLAARYDVIAPGDRVSLLTSTSFATSDGDAFGALLMGATLCPFDLAARGLADFGDWIDRRQITLLHPPALLFRRFLATLEGSNLFPSVRQVSLAGDVVLPADVQRWRRHFCPSCTLMYRFSSTEAGHLAVARIDAAGESIPDVVSAGRPVPDKHLVLVDELGQAVPAGEVGELVVKSAYMADGYWRRPQETAAAFQPDPDDPRRRIYRTGDRGRFLEDGSFVFAGRRDFQVKIRGYRIDTREVESALLQLDDVCEAVVTVYNDADEPRLVGYVVMKSGLPFDAALVRQRLGVNLPAWKIPARLVPLAFLPTTLTGKVDRQALPPPESVAAPAPEAVAGPASPAVPARLSRTSSEVAVIEIWRDLLGTNDVKATDSFFDLGGDSVLAFRMLLEVEDALGVRLAPDVLVAAPTVEQFAARLDGESSDRRETPCLVALQPQGKKPPLFCVPQAAGTVLAFRQLARRLGADQPFYSFQHRGMEGSLTPHSRVQSMAECYLSEVRAVQPRGPYFLAGLCFGGLVAFDMAQKLLARGEEVSFLGMFDLLRPPRGMRERWGRYAPLRLISRTWHHLRRGTLRSVVSNELVRMRPPTPATEGRLAQIFQIHQRAMRRYRMRKYPGRVTLFLSDEIRQRLRGRPSEWDRWAAGGLEIVPVSGHHGGVHSFIREPHVAELAEKLAARLASTPLIRTPG